MTGAARRQRDALLATARISEVQGLQWQQWSGPESGPRLLLLHGGFGSWNHWFANIESLRKQRELWTVDLPGLGRSAAIDASASPGVFSHWLLSSLQKLSLDQRPLHIAGFSFGAMVGIHLARQLGDCCTRFTAIGAAGWGELHVQVPLAPPPSPDTDWDAAAPVHEANLRALMFSPDAVIDELAVYLHSENLASARFNSRALSRTDDFIRLLPSLEAECLCVWGSEDATAGGDHALAARQVIIESAGGRFQRLPGVGHWAMYEAAEATNTLLLN